MLAELMRLAEVGAPEGSRPESTGEREERRFHEKEESADEIAAEVAAEYDATGGAVTADDVQSPTEFGRRVTISPKTLAAMEKGSTYTDRIDARKARGKKSDIIKEQKIITKALEDQYKLRKKILKKNQKEELAIPPLDIGTKAPSDSETAELDFIDEILATPPTKTMGGDGRPAGERRGY